MAKEGKGKKYNIRDLLIDLYFCKGLEDIRFLHHLKRSVISSWCKTNGELICQAVFAVMNGADPHKVMVEMNRERK